MMKISICAICKQENLYLRDWVEYYYKMGIKNIILYDNNDINGEYPQNVIGDYISNGFVIYKNARGKYRYQVEAYTQCYKEYKTEYDWIGFLDIDEYWYLRPDITFDEFFSEERLPSAIGLFINWLNYGDNDKLHYENKPVQERFPNPTTPIDFISSDVTTNSVCKLFVKCYKEEVDILFYDANGFDYYYTTPEPFKIYFVNGLEYGERDTLYDFTMSYIKHYRTLTIEEYLYRRFGRRGYADYASHHNKEKIINYFWDQNKWTEEKQQIIDNFFEMFEVVDDAPVETKRIFDEE